MLPALADDVITNIMSPVVSYQYQQSLSETLTNGGVISPLASYQYYEYRGTGSPLLNSSPTASYYFQFFETNIPSLLQVQAIPGKVIVAWPVSWPFALQNFRLQISTNLTETKSWLTLPDIPAMVNLQNTITNLVTGSQGFYRLILAH